MKPKLNLDKKTLLENVFARALHGYSPDEVDRFLDKVIADYGQYEQTVTELNALVINLKNELDVKKNELASMSAMYSELKARTPDESQLSMLQRGGDINRLTSEIQKLLETMGSNKPKKD